MEDQAEWLAKLCSKNKDFAMDAQFSLNRDRTLLSMTLSSNESLDVTIVVAIAVTILASLLLPFALLVAWKTGWEQRQEAHLDGVPRN